MTTLNIASDKSITPSTNAKPLGPEEKGGYIPDKTVKAEKRITASPYDTEAWSILIREAQTKKIDDARQTYERLVEQFPTAGKYWKIYIEHEVYPITCRYQSYFPRWSCHAKYDLT